MDVIFACGKCESPLHGPDEPKPDSMLRCPTCGESDTFDNVKRIVGQFLQEQAKPSFNAMTRWRWPFHSRTRMDPGLIRRRYDEPSPPVRPLRSELRAKAFECPADGGGEIAQGVRLQPVGENARQKRLRQMEGSGPAKDVSPLQAKAGQIERCEIGDRRSELRLVDGSPRQRGQTLAGAARCPGRAGATQRALGAQTRRALP
jgi:hypothetical protein